MRRTLLHSVVFLGVALCFVGSTRAQAPGDPGDPLGANPPVRQSIGMMDTLLGSLTAAECRVCHSSGVLERHHNLFDESIPEGSLVPFPDTDGDGVNDEKYGCLSCHELDTSSGSIRFLVERDCVVCHTSTAHHATPSATTGDCVSCHGDVVTNADDGHYIPTYAPSQTTPAVKDGEGLPLNNRGNGAGACNYCHDDDGKFAGDSGNPDERIILNNFDLHHGQGFTDCGLCHVQHALNIRDCERCHGVDSLHNIQADSNGDGVIVPGGELAGYGHVGKEGGAGDSDCWGCHGFAKASAAAASLASPVVPTLYNVDVKSIAAGSDAPIVLSGVGFTNVAGNTTYESDVRLTAADGSTVTLEPDAVSEATVAVTIPGNLAPGNYKIQAVKKGVASNPAVISIVPEVTISSVVSDGVLTIRGSGFGGHAEGSGTSVNWPVAFGLGKYQQSMVKPATVISWTDTEIVVDFGSSSPDKVVVNSVYGAAAADVEGVSPPQPEPEQQPEPQPQPEPEPNPAPQPEPDSGGGFSFRGGLDFNFGIGNDRSRNIRRWWENIGSD